MLRKLLGLARTEPIDVAQWQRITASLPFLGHLDEAERALLKGQCEAFLAAKAFSGAAGFVIDDQVRIAIALQACLPALHLGLSGYRDFVEIVVYPDRFVAPRKEIDEAGVMHEYDDELAGEAMQGGPVVLSWPDADPAGGHAGYNVVIHEFAHKLDMLDGSPDGAPPLPAGMRARWTHTMTTAYEDFCTRLDRIEAAIPRHVDPESAAADAWYDGLPLDPYAATDPGEFFAVAAETFFTAPQALAHAYPALYALFRDYFRQDPLTGTGDSRSR
ncbi:MAG: zinc-dependent peptidase [Burkholderiaceae bacterium]|nr:zinc-dependent peptidase [Burkholderiaceae bacterium]MEB2350901.1 zinc-dependent peptidase [Burkholderiaceae bacterium]